MKVATTTTRLRPYRMDARATAARETADRVLDVAVELFTERAYEDVSLDDVADRAQVSKRTVLRRFRSKEDLFVAAGERAGTEMMRRRNEAPVGDIRAAIANVTEHYERWGDYRLRLLAQADRISLVADDVRAGRQFHWSWVEKTFEPLLQGSRGFERKRRIAALVVLTDVFTWKLLRRDLGFSRSETEGVLLELIGKYERRD